MKGLKVVLASVALIFSMTSNAAILSAEESEFATLINNYRVENGLSVVDVTNTLTDVAQAHVDDLFTYQPHNVSSNCSLHSWSDNGSWTGGCYTSDHSNATLMWNKPSEFSNGAYSGFGFELIGYGFASVESMLDGFKSYAGYNDVLLNQNTWSSYTWASMGVGVHERYYSIWFGSMVDPQGLVSTSVVPVPAAVWLFGSGLIGLVGIARRKQA